MCEVTEADTNRTGADGRWQGCALMVRWSGKADVFEENFYKVKDNSFKEFRLKEVKAESQAGR